MTHLDITARPLGDSSHDEPDIIIEGGILITMVDGEDPINPARVCVKKNRIVDVQVMDEAFPSPANAEVIDASDCIIMPGLINSFSGVRQTICPLENGFMIRFFRWNQNTCDLKPSIGVRFWVALR